MSKADNFTTFLCAVVMKSGNLNFLEPSGPLQACNGTDLPLHVPVGNVAFSRVRKAVQKASVY